MELRRLLLTWIPFALVAALPAALVVTVAWRARSAAIVEAESEDAARLTASAKAAKRELDGRVEDGKRLVRALPEGDEPKIASPPPGADAVLLDAQGALTSPPPPKTDLPLTPECEAAQSALLGPGRADARATILAHCTDLRSSGGRYLWPLLALESEPPQGLGEWLSAHGDRLSGPERDALRKRVAGTDAERALTAPPSAWSTLRALLESPHQERADGVLRIHEGAFISILRTSSSGRAGGLVFHGEALLRAPPALPDDLVLASGAGTTGTEVRLTPELAFHVAVRDPAATRSKLNRAGDTLFAAACVAVLASLALATLLYRRFLAARRLAELRTDFVSAVSHELRTPLASVQMLAELLEQGEVAEDERPEVEKTLAAETRRLADTLGRMLRFGALSRGKLTVSRAKVPLQPIATGAIERFHQRSPKLAVELTADPELEGDVDAGLLGLALDNLLGNAAKYAPAGAPYQLGMTAERDRLRISLRDRGPGLDRRAQKRVFLPFERADDRLSRATEGTGIGLSLVRGIAEAHDGRAWVESEPGQGATFYLELPWKPS